MSNAMLVFGAGFSGKAIAKEAASRGWRVFGTTRSEGKLGAIADTGAEPLLFDGTDPSPAVRAALAVTTHIVVSAAPGREGDPVLRAFAPLGHADVPRLSWLGYLSTVGVYGDQAGRWIDETAPVRPGSTRSEQRAAAETEWGAAATRLGVPLCLIRLSGIYGPGRNAMANVADGSARRLVKPGQVFNRIHVDDIAGATLFLAERGTAGAVNVTDDEPAPPQEVVAYAAARLGRPVPPARPFAAAELGEMARSFYAENKRVSNARLKALGYRFRHADYRRGLDALLADTGHSA